MDIALYYFDTLPLHPRPQPLESFTSYLTRIAEANGISHLSGLNAFFGGYSHFSRFADYPPPSFGMLPTLTSRSEAELLETTFYHAGKKFDRVCQPRFLARFFSGLIASSLRFCPLCLQEDLFYRLTWRFLSLRGCPKHACHLLEHCSSCGCLLPIFASPLRIGACPACKGDLRTSVAPRLTEEELQRAFKASQEIEFLLCPHSWETTEPALREKLGQEFILLRYNKQLKRMDVSAETTLSMSILERIELGQRNSSGVTLRWYFKYANYLGVPLNHIFINALERKEEDLRIRTMSGKYFLASEDWVMDRVQEAVKQLEISGQRLTIKSICEETGISKQALYKYDRVKTLLGGVLYHKDPPPRLQDPLYKEQLLEKAQQAVQELSRAGKPITHQAVSSLIGIRSSAIVYHPQVKKFLGQFVDYALQQQRHAKGCEQAFLEEVRTAVMDLEEDQQPVTYNAISQKIGSQTSAWLAYAQVRAFVEQHLGSRYLPTLKKREQREEVLISRVEEAVNQLEAEGKPVTFTSVGRLLGVDRSTLMTHPHVNAFIEQKKSPPRTKGVRARRSEEEVLSDVQRIISFLTERNASINYAAIAREMGGISGQTLQTYPKVRMLVDEYLQSDHLYQLQQFALREEQLLCRMEAAITELEALGKPFAQSELLEKVGKSRNTLKGYPRVNALLEQKVTRHHVFQRLRDQPELEDLVQQVKQAIIDLAGCGEHVTPSKIARKVHLSQAVLMQYPEVVLLLEQSGYQKRKLLEREEELLDLVKNAIHVCRASGQPITKEGLSSMVGINRTTLFHYPAVRALMTQAANEDQQQLKELRFQKREEELAQQVVNAIQQLRNSGRRVSALAVGKIVHVSSRSLHHYSKVRTLLESAITAQRTASKSAQK